MRIGETLALTWDDIDFKKRIISINKTITNLNGEILIGPPKTENSNRTLLMSNTVYNLLKLVEQDQLERKQYLKNVYEDHNIVFSASTGNYIDRHTISSRLKTIKKGTDYEYITVHFLRHANATLLLMNDVDIKIVSAHLGHSDISTTADIYADVLKEKKERSSKINRI
jgi:integrase